MHRLSRLLTILTVLIVTGTVPAVAAERLPNIVVFLADDLGYGELGCYGQTRIQTPHIDQLAREGMRFTDFYSGNAVCAPSRCCLMTGKHPGTAYIRGNGDPKDLQYLAPKHGWEFPGQHPIPDQEITLAELLQQQGYATAAIGKWGLGHFGTSGDPNRQGFDLFYGFNCQRHAHNHYPRFLWRNGKKEPLPGNDRTLRGETYSQDRFTEVALDFIRSHAEEPFFLYMPFAIPHLSIQVPDDSLAAYVDKIPEADYKHRGYLRHPRPRAGYAAMVSHLDRDIGRIMDELANQGLDQDTLVLFTSDNGPTFERLGGADSDFFHSTAGLRGRKGSLYEGGIRVPMIARWKGTIPEQSTSNRIAAFWDILPTVCEIANAKAPAVVNGHSFAQTLLGKHDPPAPYLYWEFPSYGGQQAIRAGKWKAVRQGLSKATTLQNGNLELYDLSQDPSESTNVAAHHPDVVQKLADQMQAARSPSVRFPFPVLDAVNRPSIRPGINDDFANAKLQVENWEEKFEVESREVYAQRDAIVAATQVSPGEVIADIGSGTGLFTFLFAKAVGDTGHVHAVDIATPFMQHVERKAKREGVHNVTTIRGRSDTAMLSADSLDKAFLCDTYHHLEYPQATLASLHTALRPRGQLIVVDFHRIPGTSREWVLEHVRADRETVQREIEQAGFRLIDEPPLPGLRENYVLRFERR